MILEQAGTNNSQFRQRVTVTKTSEVFETSDVSVYQTAPQREVLMPNPYDPPEVNEPTMGISHWYGRTGWLLVGAGLVFPVAGALLFGIFPLGLMGIAMLVLLSLGISLIVLNRASRAKIVPIDNLGRESKLAADTALHGRLH